MIVEPDTKAATIALDDRGEHPDLMEPLLLSRHTPGAHFERLQDLVTELVAAAAGFRRSLPQGVLSELVKLVRAMNCYYSNQLEGHTTHPVDIERAMHDDYSTDPEQRQLQHEACAHVTVQQWIDAGGLGGRGVTAESLCEVHRRFCELLPDELLVVTHRATGESVPVIPGEFRHRDVQVGQHVPISPGAIPRFLARFEDVYGGLGRTATILAAAAAHHRLLWVHPFLDGNGRVARLMSHAVLLDALDTGGIWSIARGLGRHAPTYKNHLMHCDAPRRNDYDGRGALSEDALATFTEFFLATCLDQVRFMEEIVEPRGLRARILLWAEEEARLDKLPDRTGQVLEAVLLRGDLPRGDVPGLVGASPRHARRVVSSLIDRGVLTSTELARTAARSVSAALASRWMLGLFPPADAGVTPR